MTALEQYIQSYFGVSTPELATIRSLFREESLEKGAFLVRAGHYCDRLSFVREGLLRVFADDGKREVTQWISTSGYFVTDLSSLLFGSPARWNIQCLTPCALYTISRADYERIGTLVSNWHELEKRFIAKCFLTLEDRVFQFLSLTAEERFALLFAQHSELFQQVPQNYLASMLGMTPETFSRIKAARLRSSIR